MTVLHRMKSLTKIATAPLRLTQSSQRTYLQFGPEHEELRNTTRKIVTHEINPYVDQWEKEGIFDGRKVFKALGNANLLGITRPTEFNGQGLDYSFSVAFIEEFAKTINCGGVMSGVVVQTDMAVPALSNFGSDELRKEFLAPTLKGDFIACVGVTEASGGSDVAALKTSAKRVGDDLVINGEKMWITNGYQADWMCLLANTSQGSPHQNKSLICVPLNAKGITRSLIPKMGQHSSDTAIVSFDNVKVPVKNIIGEPDKGFTYQMIQFQEERLCIAAGTTPSLQRVIDETIAYCRQRHTFGKALIDNQHVHFKLAYLISELELFKALFYKAATDFSEGNDATYLASILKLKAGRLSREITDECLQFFGGMGYSDEMLISRMYRDARVMSIAGGADEIMLGIIAKYQDILPKKSKNN